MHIVYKLIFVKRKEAGLYPFLYIGSKSNATFSDNKILNIKNKAYYGSSSFKNYRKIVKENLGFIDVECLFESTNYEECLQVEQDTHIRLNVVLSPEYFNGAIAKTNLYHDPNYALMRNVISGKQCKILKDHPDIKAGLWVGISSGMKWYNNTVTAKTFKIDEQPTGWVAGRLPSGKAAWNKGTKTDPEKVKLAVASRIKNGGYLSVWNKGMKNVIKTSKTTKEKMSLSHKLRYASGGVGSLSGKFWITDGEKNQIVSDVSKIPNGWNRGQTKTKYVLVRSV